MMRRLALGLVLLALIGCARQPEPINQMKPATAGAHEAPFPIQAELPGSAVDIDGDWLVVQNDDRLTAHHLQTGKTRIVPTKGRLWGGFAVGGGKLVWADLRNDPHVKVSGEQQVQPNLWNWDIMLMDLATGEVVPVTKHTAAQWRPHTDGRTIVWEDSRNDTTNDYYGYPDIYSYDIETGTELRLTNGQGGHFRPRVDSGKVVWMDGRNNVKVGGARGCGNCPENNWDIYGHDLAARQEFMVATAPSMEDSPDISGDRIVWIERGTGGQVHLLNLQTGEREPLTDGSVARSDVRIDGQRVVWMDERRGHAINDVVVNGQKGNADIFLYDITDRQEVRLTGDSVQMIPVISGMRVAFVYSTQVNPQVQLVEVP